jgi:hypothetical protein
MEQVPNPGTIYDRLVGFYRLRMPNLETIDFCYDGESTALFRYSTTEAERLVNCASELLERTWEAS